MKRELRNVGSARRKLESARISFEAYVLEAREAGCTLREIAPHAGITNPAVMFVERRAWKRREEMREIVRALA